MVIDEHVISKFRYPSCCSFFVRSLYRGGFNDTGNQIQEESERLHHHQNRLKRIKKYISDNLSTDLSVAVVSEKLNVSISNLQHSLKKHLLKAIIGMWKK